MRETCWEEPHKDPEGEKPARGERGEDGSQRERGGIGRKMSRKAESVHRKEAETESVRQGSQPCSWRSVAYREMGSDPLDKGRSPGGANCI
ncbi:hypothetical protein NDU88_004439 [Pleurodeles waltl]|uniref:Uncharacterized protein n=1 Tax=Pleurodeles waltl TaxID=8319 RepID=A0AAV7SIS5_PLEWA|nr:hypothetical protein NDU88_004439 [Pleurodeles waltl]